MTYFFIEGTLRNVLSNDTECSLMQEKRVFLVRWGDSSVNSDIFVLLLSFVYQMGPPV